MKQNPMRLMRLTAEGLLAGYGRKDIVNVPTLAFESGTITALIGPNAAGKSTLVRALCGAHRPRSGSVWIEGRDVYGLSSGVRARQIAYVSQQNNDQFAFTVRELVSLGAEANTIASRPAAKRTAEALETMDLSAIADRDLLGLSGGERQRAGIARALAQETPVLVLDEPTAHLDLRHQAALMRAAHKAAGERQAAVLLVLHDLNLAASFADRLILLAAGKIVAEGKPGEVLTADIIQTVYQTKVLILESPLPLNPFVHLDPGLGKSIDHLV